jgi:hypothetical protein
MSRPYSLILGEATFMLPTRQFDDSDEITVDS